MSKRVIGSALPDRMKEVWQHQADAVLSQANPVSTTLYTVLDTTANVRLISGAASVTWTVQPTPLDLVITIDGQTLTAGYVNPATATMYQLMVQAHNAEPALVGANTSNRAFELEGRSVKIQARTTGGTTSSLDSRIKYARMT